MPTSPTPPIAAVFSFTTTQFETAIGLGNGSVLLDHKSSFSVLDPSTGNESLVSVPFSVASDHTIVSLADGGAMIVSGVNDTNKNSPETLIFNASQLRWDAGPRLNEGRNRPAAIVDAKKSVWVIGGYKEPEARTEGNTSQEGREALPSVEVLEAGATTWKTINPLVEPRVFPIALNFPNGHILVAGGWSYNKQSASDTLLNSAEVIDSESGQWSAVGRIFTHPGWTSYQKVRSLANDRVLVTERDETSAWDVSGGLAKRLSKVESNATSTTWTPNGQGVAFGVGKMSQQISLWTPEFNSKSIPGNLTFGRKEAQAFWADDERFVVFGGYGRDSWHVYTYLAGWLMVLLVAFGFLYRAYWGHKAAGSGFTRGVLLGSAIMAGLFFFFFHFISNLMEINVGVRG